MAQPLGLNQLLIVLEMYIAKFAPFHQLKGFVLNIVSASDVPTHFGLKSDSC